MTTHREKYDELERKRRLAEAPAGPEAVNRQHARGKRTAAERIAALVDTDSFTEFDQFVVHRTNAFGLDEKEFLGDGVVTGRATIEGRQSFSSRRTLRSSAVRWVKPSPKNLQGDRARVAHRLADDRDQRLGRRANPRRCRFARRIRGDLLAQRPGQRRFRRIRA